MHLVILSHMEREKDQSDVTGFGRFDSGTCKRVLNLL